MSDSDLLPKLRQFLMGLAALMFVATIVELIFAKHTDGWVQLIPFLCCTAGLVMLALVWQHPDPRVLLAHRTIMGVVLAASLFGIYEHIMSAVEITRDFHPGLRGMDFWKTVLTSSTPILAPGALAATAFVALISTYGLQPQRQAAPQRRSLHRV
jgi:hypothetical protein